jgi:AcrR family transcriptional regulator
MAQKSLRAAYAIATGVFFSSGTAYAQQQTDAATQYLDAAPNHNADNDNRAELAAPTQSEIDRYYYQATLNLISETIKEGPRFLPYLSDEQKRKIVHIIKPPHHYVTYDAADGIQKILALLPDDQKDIISKHALKAISSDYDAETRFDNIATALAVSPEENRREILNELLEWMSFRYRHPYAHKMLPLLPADLKRDYQIKIINDVNPDGSDAQEYLHLFYPYMDEDLQDQLIDKITEHMTPQFHLLSLKLAELSTTLSAEHFAQLSRSIIQTIPAYVDHTIQLAREHFPNDPERMKEALSEYNHTVFNAIIYNARYLVPHLNGTDKSQYAKLLIKTLTHYNDYSSIHLLHGLFSDEDEKKLSAYITSLYATEASTYDFTFLSDVEKPYAFMPFLPQNKQIEILEDTIQVSENYTNYISLGILFRLIIPQSWKYFEIMPAALQDRYTQLLINNITPQSAGAIYLAMIDNKDIFSAELRNKTINKVIDDLHDYLDLVPSLMEHANESQKSRLQSKLLNAIKNSDSSRTLAYMPDYINYIPASKKDALYDYIIERFVSRFDTRTSSHQYLDILPANRNTEIVDRLLSAARNRINADPDLIDRFIVGFTRIMHRASDTQRTEIYQLISDSLLQARTLVAFASPSVYMHILPDHIGKPLIHGLVEKHYISKLTPPRMYGGYDYPHWYAYINEETIDQLETIRGKRDRYLRTMRQINDLHEEPDHVRFASLASYDAQALYELIILGREELYTSSYLGVFQRLQDAMAAEGIAYIDDMADPRHENMPATFLNMAMEYGTESEAFTYISPQMWEKMAAYFTAQIEGEDEEALVSFTKIIQSQPDNEIRENFKNIIRQNFIQAPNPKTRDVYGLLINYYNQGASDDQITLENADRYEIPDTTQITREQLLGSDDIHRQLMVFTDDHDGHSSYSHMVSFYRGNPNYKLENNQDYIKISSNSGVPIELYANHPDKDPYEIRRYLRDLPQDEIDFVIHRGHSYNLDNTMPFFSEDNTLMFLGSCGGYNNVSRLLDIAPMAQIISTKQTGTMYVNDPLLFYINEQVRQHGELQWEDAQNYLDKFRNSNARHYTLPQSNLLQNIRRKLRHLAKLRYDETVETPFTAPAQNSPAFPQP